MSVEYGHGQKAIEASQDCYAQARITLDPSNKRTLVQKGDQSLKKPTSSSRGAPLCKPHFRSATPRSTKLPRKIILSNVG